ncbi:helix-turn-helix domain-containing protein [Brumimicrobium aurantiacum]|uniref:XRE family transcriptional regulator n=1 Tax=Brumimicrobium aurantiacum TaxID=1737063 RepID=A0A3E1F199_9FLAO|nr:helix-turn-helix transcriptional regulator [Brumimicrobium aurantiacum]RFC55588.1 XRE family transcriptional regulator [Brumimicrobium aurantiacum]
MILDANNKIKKIRELKNLTQEFLAQEIGISTRAYSKIETGETKITIDRLNQIGEILEIPAIEILGFNEKQIFNNCRQEGNIGINHNYSSKELNSQFENQINHLKSEIVFLRSLLKK